MIDNTSEEREVTMSSLSVVYRGGGLGVQIPPPPEIPGAVQKRPKPNPITKTLKVAEFSMPTSQDVRKSSKILKLLRFGIVLH